MPAPMAPFPDASKVAAAARQNGMTVIAGEVGHGLRRPECVLAHSSGLLFAPDWSGNGGVAIVYPDGEVQRVLATGETFGGSGARDVPFPLRPNGIALEAGGRFLLAHLGDEYGGIYRLYADGRTEVVVDRLVGVGELADTASSLTGMPVGAAVVESNPRLLDPAWMPPTNFVVADDQGRLWITVSTRLTPRSADYRADAASGFIAVAQPGERSARIVAGGLGYANECVIDAKRGFVYVNETFGRRLTRFRVASDGTLDDKTVIVRFGAGIYPDGLALDQAGALLVTSIVSNCVLRVQQDGRIETLLDDSDAVHVAWAEAAYQSDNLGRPHLDIAKGERLKNVSNLAFGGPDMRTAWLGNLLGETLPWFRVDVPGLKMPHYDLPLGELARLNELT